MLRFVNNLRNKYTYYYPLFFRLMPAAFYLEDTEDYIIERVELLFHEDNDHEEDERSSQADHERLADRFNA